jgi:hypothetical protein
LCQRHEVADGVGEGVGVAVGPAGNQERGEFGAGARPFLHQRPARRHDRGEVDPGELLAEGRAAETARQDRLHQRAQGQAVAGGDEVDRGAHQRCAHRAALGEQRRQFVVTKAVESGPEANVRRIGSLGLQADQVLNRLGGREAVALEEQLPREEGAVEGARIEHLGRSRWHGFPPSVISVGAGFKPARVGWRSYWW